MHRRRSPRSVRTPERHHGLELVLIEDGGGSIETQASTVRLAKDAPALFWGLVPHRVLPKPGSELRQITISLATFLEWPLPASFRQRVLAGDIVTCGKNPEPEVDAAIFRRWHRELAERPASVPRAVLLEVEAMVRRIARGESARPVTRRANNDHVAQLARIIALRFAQPVTVTEIAAEAHIHPHYATRIFHEACGIHLHECLTLHRLARAEHLLGCTDRTVLDIAMESGFGSVSQFYENFKRTWGIPPRRYRSTLLHSGGESRCACTGGAHAIAVHPVAAR